MRGHGGDQGYASQLNMVPGGQFQTDVKVPMRLPSRRHVVCARARDGKMVVGRNTLTAVGAAVFGMVYKFALVDNG